MDATLTDQIYHELADGLERGLDYDAIRVKYERNKGPFYNALARLFADLGTDIS